MELKFNISEELANMFELSLLMSGQNRDAVFESFIRNFAATTLKSVSMNQSETRTPVKQPIREDIQHGSKAARRIPLWAGRPYQYNHGIVRAFLENENGNGFVDRSVMRDSFLSNYPDANGWQFEQNLASMCTEEGNSHGKVFNINGNIVTLESSIEKLVYSLKDQFLN